LIVLIEAGSIQGFTEITLSVTQNADAVLTSQDKITSAVVELWQSIQSMINQQNMTIN